MHDEARGNGELAADLKHAIEHDELSVHYQPVVDIATGRIREVEALARWEHPHRGPIPPDTFIPIAEESDLILPLGQWMLATACRQVREWQRENPDLPPLTVNVNLSAKQVQQATIVEDVRRTLREAGLDARSLQLEVTERLPVEQSLPNLKTLRELRQLGASISLDDFGTGFSGIPYLSWMPASHLKVDRSYIQQIGKTEEDTALVRGLIAMAKGLRLTVTAEGVETAEQHALLQDLGCDQGQGYYYARPLTSREMGLRLRQRRQLGAVASAEGTSTSARRSAEDERHVLIIDDDPAYVQMLRFWFEGDGYKVATAAHGTAALEYLKRHTPSVILLDMWMPVMDGETFTKAYHELPGPHAPIVVVTALDDPAPWAAQVGAKAHFRKPFMYSELLAKIEDLVLANAA
jgi:EAL domain-containing protein (putative c-di-GMP-specific phosphodiesterase class I)